MERMTRFSMGRSAYWVWDERHIAQWDEPHIVQYDARHIVRCDAAYWLLDQSSGQIQLNVNGA
jgi:hypothetical protein